MNQWAKCLGIISGICLTAVVMTEAQNQGEPKEGPGLRQRGQFPGGPEGGPRGGGMMRMIPVMAALDTNADGTISADEIKNASESLKKLDLNKDGQLTEDELRPQGGPRGEGPRGEDGPRGPGQGGPNLETLVNRILANDKNGDGKIEVSEVEARMAGIVRRADSNQDGFATREELSTLFANETGRPNRDDRPQRGPGRPE